MKNKTNLIYTIVVIVLSVSLLTGLVFLNVKPSKKKENTTKPVQTTKPVKNLIYDKEAEIIVNGEYVTIPLKTYVNNSYSIDYDITSFNLVNVSNGDVYLKDNENPENYLYIKVLDLEEYNRVTSMDNNENNNPDLVEKTMFYKGDRYYITITVKYTNDDNTFNRLNPRINYMLTTLHVN